MNNLNDKKVEKKILFGDSSLHKMYLCGCGLSHTSVEAGGIWYCPNPACGGSGSNWFTSKLTSLTRKNGEYEIDVLEWVEALDKEIEKMVLIGTDKAILDATKYRYSKLKNLITATKYGI